MYGTLRRQAAESLLSHLQHIHPDNRYELALHDPRRGTWGVLLYTPYCEQMPFRCEGFVWHNY